MATIWYYKTTRSIHGPFTLDQLRAHARRGRVCADSLIRKGKSGEWIEAFHLKELWEYKRVAKNGNTKSAKLNDATTDKVDPGHIASNLKSVSVQLKNANDPQMSGTEIATPEGNGAKSSVLERKQDCDDISYPSLNSYASFCEFIGWLGIVLLVALIVIGSLAVYSNPTYPLDRDTALKDYWATAWPHFITLGFASFMSLAMGEAIMAFIDLVVNTIRQRVLTEEMIRLLRGHGRITPCF